MIELKNVAKSYGEVWPISELSLHIDKGEFVAILGPSGSGKTTLLYLMAGLLTPCQGEVIIDGISLYQENKKEQIAYRRNNFGFVFQDFNLIPYLTVLQNVEIPLHLIGKDKQEQKQQALELLKSVHLEDKTERLPKELSAGEQQRAAIARALANNPQIVFADEPTGNLDSENGKEIMNHMEALSRKGRTVLLVTHDAGMAACAHRQIRLEDGRLCNEN